MSSTLACEYAKNELTMYYYNIDDITTATNNLSNVS
jgi:hypothetical protein